MPNKKILVFIDWYLPGFKAGGPVRSIANLVSHLKNEFDFFIITGNTDYCETTPYSNIKSDEWNVLPDGTNVFYFSKKNHSAKNFKKQISIVKPDFIYINGIYSYKFSVLSLLISRKLKNIKTIVAARGMLAPSAIAVKKTRKSFYLKCAKILGLYSHVTFHATNEDERKNIVSVLGKNIKIRVAPNLPFKFENKIFPSRIKEKHKLKLVSIARIAPEKNTRYALEILSSVTGNVEFDLYGTIYNENYWNECMQIHLPENIKVKYCGCTNNVDEILRNYHFMLMPTFGENFGHSVFESFSTGCPVIISDKTPWKNLAEKKVGWDIPLHNKSKFVETLEKCVQMEQEEYDTFSHNAFEFAKKIAEDTNAVELNRNLFL